MEFDVATVERQALVLLMTAGQRVFVSIELIAGRLRLSYRSSDGTVERVNAPATASDGLWHHVVAGITNTVCINTTAIPLTRFLTHVVGSSVSRQNVFIILNQILV